MATTTHPHPTRPDAPRSSAYFQVMEIAVRELLIDKGVFTADEVRREVEKMDARTPAPRAPASSPGLDRPRLQGAAPGRRHGGCHELGIEMGPTELVVVENRPGLHNLVVCTLCSCYPRMLLGLPPDWYKSRSYRSRAVREPRAVLPSSAPSCRTTSRCASTIRPPTCATSSCPSGPPAPRRSTRPRSPRSSPAIRWSASPAPAPSSRREERFNAEAAEGLAEDAEACTRTRSGRR